MRQIFTKSISQTHDVVVVQLDNSEKMENCFNIFCLCSSFLYLLTLSKYCNYFCFQFYIIYNYIFFPIRFYVSAQDLKKNSTLICVFISVQGGRNLLGETKNRLPIAVQKITPEKFQCFCIIVIIKKIRTDHCFFCRFHQNISYLE